MPGEGQKLRIEHNGARLCIVLTHERSSVVEKHFLSYAVEGQEGALQAVKPGFRRSCRNARTCVRRE